MAATPSFPILSILYIHVNYFRPLVLRELFQGVYRMHTVLYLVCPVAAFNCVMSSANAFLRSATLATRR